MEKQLMEFIKTQSEMMEKMVTHLKNISVDHKDADITVSNNIPWPPPLNVEFGDIRENFENFESSWNDYTIATGINLWPATRNKQKASTMLSAIGVKAKEKFMEFGLTDAEKESDIIALAAIRKYLIANSNVIYDRYIFNTSNQMENESFDTYLIRIKRLIKLCNYPTNMSDELLRDRIVVGIRNGSVMKNLMEKSDLTLQHAIDTCRISEATQCRVKNMTTENNVQTSVPVNKISNTRGQTSASNVLKKCRFCGAKHKFEKGCCPALGHICDICKYKHHFESCCRRRNKESDKNSTFHRSNKVNQIDCDEEEEQFRSNDESFKICKVMTSFSKNKVTAILRLKFNSVWENVECMLDTGSNACLMGWQQYSKLMNKPNPETLPTQQGLIDFNGNPIPSIGEAHIPCKIDNRIVSIVFQIIKRNHQPLLSLNACSALKLIAYSSEVKNFPVPCKADYLIESVSATAVKKTTVNHRSKANAERIVNKYSDIFEGYGTIPGEVELEIDESIKPVIQHARRIPVTYRHRLKTELDGLVKDGLIERVEHHTDWVSNILIVQRNNSFRICLDPIPLNKALKRPNYQFTTIDEVLPELGKAKVFSTCDAKKGFWQVQLSEASSNLTCFWTPFGRYKWLRMPFGITSAPEIFQMKIYQLVHDLPGVEVLADDLLIFGQGDTVEEATVDHDRNLENLFMRLQKNNVKLNKSKLILCQSSVKFFGHVLSKEGLKVDESKIMAIRNMKTPSNKNDLQRFIGMVNYLSRYIRDLSTQFTPLRELIHENTPWKWTQSEEDEYQKIKSLVSDIRTLGYFDNTKPIIIECDSSSTGLGAAMFQEDKVICYASRTLTATERNYAQIEKELLAIVFACVRFDQMIVGHTCVIRTDHKPLINIFNKTLLKSPKRLQLMRMILQRYSLKLEFIEGKNNIIADTLSRANYEEDPDENQQENILSKSNICRIDVAQVSDAERLVQRVKIINSLSISTNRLNNIREETAKDVSFQKIITLINKWPKNIRDLPDDIKIYHKFKHELSTENGLLLRNDKVLIPYSLRGLMIEKVHTSHNGIEATVNLAKQNIFWPGMTSEIRDKVKDCYICVKYSDSQIKPPMLTHEVPNYPFQIVSMDVFYEHIKGKAHKFLITVDHYSDFFEINKLDDLKPNSTIKMCKINFSRHGIPETVLTDGGTNFVSSEFREFANKWGFSHITSAPYHQQANGKAEAAVKIAKRIIKKSNETGEDFWYALLHFRNIPNKIGSSPVQRLFARKTRTGIPSIIKNLQPEVVPNVSDKIINQRQINKYHYDKKTKQLPLLEVGQPVVVQIHPTEDKLWSRGTVQQRLSDRSFVVNVNGSAYRRDRVNIKPHSAEDHKQSTSVNILPLPSCSANSILDSTRNTEGNTIEGNNQQTSSEVEQPSIVVNTETPQTSLNRPRREVKPPSRFKDFILTK